MQQNQNPTWGLKALQFSGNGPSASYGGGGGISRFPGGGGGNRGDNPQDFGETLQRYRLGLAVGMVAIFMLFFSFSAAYLVRHITGAWDVKTQRYVHESHPVNLPLGLIWFNTAVLLVGSLSIEKARRSAFREAAIAPITALPGIAPEKSHTTKWAFMTLGLGIVFLGGQAVAWKELAARGYYLSTTPGASFFYLLTALHAIHLFGGILALLWAAVVLPLRPSALERRRITFDVTAWYWHFMGLLWIFILLLLLFAS